jgi:hypothetical protein
MATTETDKNRAEREKAKAKAWANYVKVRDAENARLKATEEKHGRTARGFGNGDFDPDGIKAKIKREIEEKYKAAIEKAAAIKQAEQDKASAAIEEARKRRTSLVDAAWQAFEVLDVGGKTRRQ